MTAASPSTAPTLADISVFAPQVRVVGQNGEVLMIAEQAVSQDVMSVTVTQPCSGVGQVEIMLNNQRFGRNAEGDAKDYALPVPPWRYNALRSTEVAFGSRLRVDMRYGQNGWTPMMLVRVTDISFGFPTGAGASLTLKCEDLLSLLKIKPAQDYNPPSRMVEEDRVADEIRMSGCGLAFAGPDGANLFTQPLAITHDSQKTYLQFIQELADRMDYEVYVDFDDPGAPLSGNGAVQLLPKLHFAPTRAAALGEPLTIKAGLDVIEFKPAFKIWEMLTGARYSGNVPRARGTYDQTITMADAMSDRGHTELHTAPEGAAPITAADARRTAFETEASFQANMHGDAIANNIAKIQAGSVDEDRARMQAIATLRKSAREFLTADVTIIGNPALRPGRHINLAGYAAPFDGIYYVTQVVHALSASGYITRLSLRRPGMLDPATYPGNRA